MQLLHEAPDFSPQHLHDQLSSLLLYQESLQQGAIAPFIELLNALQENHSRAIRLAYGRWFRHLATRDQSWPDAVLEAVLLDDNPFSQQVQHHGLSALPPSLLQAARQDLSILYQLQALPQETLAAWVEQIVATPWPSPVHPKQQPTWLEPHRDWSEQIEAFAQHYCQQGSGLFARFHVLRWNGLQLEGIATPDPVTLEQLVGYEGPKQQLLQNTERLLGSQPALHVLLYGSRGTGKSSLVKALVHQYGPSGLRLIELPKAQLIDLPQLLDQLRQVPQKFVIFVDDLSFEADDESFKALKVVLEGSATARPDNVVVYATSNRRHLVREFHQDRPALRSADRRSVQDQNEVHAWDTVQEKLSFSDRFGLTLTFTPPQQSTYLTIVHHLADYYNLPLPKEELNFQARQWATRNNGQSGRSARQFIDWLRGDPTLNGPPHKDLSNSH